MSDPDELQADPSLTEVPDRAAALRALRSLEATEARVQRNAKLETEDAKGKLVNELLPVLDNLDRTLEAAQHRPSDVTLLEGVRMLRAQLEGVLVRYGVEKVDATNQRFDPTQHEAIGVTAVADPRAHGVVTRQAQPGYQYAGRLLRPAKVIVGKFARPDLSAPGPYWR